MCCEANEGMNEQGTASLVVAIVCAKIMNTTTKTDGNGGAEKGREGSHSVQSRQKGMGHGGAH